MKKRNILCFLAVILCIYVGFLIVHSLENKKETSNTMDATVMAFKDDKLTIQDNKHVIYTFNVTDMNADLGSSIHIEYTGNLDKNKNVQNAKIVNYETKEVSKDMDGIPTDWLDNGIFKDYYVLANNKLKTLTLDEKIGQLFLVRYPSSNAINDLKKYKFGGFVFFEKDFKDKTENQVKNMTKELQNNSKIPLLTAVDEEGGKVVRVSSNTNLVSEKFKSPSELYKAGGFDRIKNDTIEKSRVLHDLGLNLNLAPVVDVSTNPSDYMYDRTLQENTSLTSTYAKTVIEASKGTGVSYTLKHFPGYGSNSDTHSGTSTDTRTYEEIEQNDLPPFESGINAGAEAVLVSHNTVNSIDPNNPASLSKSVHNVLRNQLGFTGIIMTDDLEMGAVASINDNTIKAILAGNDLIITTDYEEGINSVKQAIKDGTIDKSLIDKLAFRVLAWKYYKGLMFDTVK